jgi:adenylate kinase
MKNIFQRTKSMAKHSWAIPVLGVVASLAVSASALLSSPAMAAEADGPYVIMIGAPGSGKSTVTAYIAETAGVPAIEVGQLLRDQVALASKSTAAGKPGSKRAQASSKQRKNIEAAKEKIEAGELVSSQAIDVAVFSILLAPGAAGGFVLDGYPGSAAQAEFLDALLATREIVPIVIYLEVSDEIALERMKSRGRVDDEHGFGKSRLEAFRTNMAPLLEYYDDGGLYTIDAGKDESDVLKQIKKVLK